MTACRQIFWGVAKKDGWFVWWLSMKGVLLQKNGYGERCRESNEKGV